MPEPQYGDTSAIPISGPDPWTSEQKQERLLEAEAMLEARVNDGDPIVEAERSHALAANAFATYLLLIGGEHPTDAQSGYAQGGAGEDVSEVAETVHGVWVETVDAILEASEDESTPTHTVSAPSVKRG